VRLAWNELILRSADEAATWGVINTRRFPAVGVAGGPIVQRPWTAPPLAAGAPRSSLLVGSGSIAEAVEEHQWQRPVVVYIFAAW
jgi:hypothetical protein